MKSLLVESCASNKRHTQADFSPVCEESTNYRVKMAPILGYWDIRGLAQPIRLLLEYTGTEYTEDRVSCGPAPDYDRSSWVNKKHSLGLAFPNLPYYIDGDIKVTQSNAILRYIARKNDLLGKTETEMVRVDIMAEQSMDFRNGLVKLCYNPMFDELRPDYVNKTLPTKLAEFSEFLGEHQWFAGENITFVDFIMYELLDQHKELALEVLEKYKNLIQFLDRFEKLNKIQDYMKTDRFLKAPMNNKMAKFGAA